MLEVNYANLEDVHTSLMYSLVVLIILKMLYKNCWKEVNNANLEDVHTSLMNSLLVLIIIKILCQEHLEVINANLEDVDTSLMNSCGGSYNNENVYVKNIWK